MKATFSFFIFSALFVFSSVTLCAQDAQFPIVKGYGGIYKVAGSEKPDSEIHYKVVVDLKTLQKKKTELNAGLNNVARMMNLHGLGGVSLDQLSVAVVVHGGATEIILSDEGYRRKNGVENPNTELISTFKKVGVEIFVCGQSLLARGYEREEVNPDVTIGLSMLTVVTEQMHNGYKLLVFN